MSPFPDDTAHMRTERMNAPITEQQLAAAAVAPRVSLEQVMAAIGDETYTVLPNGRTTICQLELAGGHFTVEGDSACVSKENFNPDFGNPIARKAAVEKIWPLLGFELARKLELIDRAGPATGAIVSLLGSRPLTYVGTKVVRAVPMSRLTYNELRGWTVPANENPEDAGYLVEYVDGGAVNVEGFAGYISWSPKDVFEKAYTVGGEPRVTTWLERLKEEADDLEVRWRKLKLFLQSPEFDKLGSFDQKDLKEQSSAMEDLHWILRRRIRRANGE